MKATVETLSSTIGRNIIDEDEVLYEVRKAEFSSMEKVKDNGHYTIVKVVVAEGRSFFNTVHAGEELAIEIIDGEVNQIMDYKEDCNIVYVSEDKTTVSNEEGNDVNVTIEVKGEETEVIAVNSLSKEVVGKETIHYDDDSILDFINKHSRVKKTKLIHI